MIAGWGARGPLTLNPQPSTRTPETSTFNPQFSTLDPQPSTLNRQPSTLNPQVAGARALALSGNMSAAIARLAAVSIYLSMHLSISIY